MQLDDYKKAFETDKKFSMKNVRALEYALDIRKLEIELYWKRATYFWTLNASVFAAYFLVSAASESFDDKPIHILLVSCIGFILSFGWFLVNKGSKQWQENWENHVYLLEDGVIGPLYKTKLSRAHEDSSFDKLITGPAQLSVSKLNQIISFFITTVWVLLVVRAFPRQVCEFFIWEWDSTIVTLTLIFAVLMVLKGKTWGGRSLSRN